MIIHFNPFFDHAVYLDNQSPNNRQWFSKTIAGPEKLLGILETHLGLAGKYAPVHRRAHLYRMALEQSVDEKSFYKSSFRADPARTAAALLKWRDELIIGGADLLMTSDLPTRISDLRNAESVFRKNKFAEFASTGDRWQKVLEFLKEESIQTKLEIKVNYPKELLTSWQKKLLSGLESSSVISIDYLPEEYTERDISTDLGKLQKALEEIKPGKFSFSGDGSVMIIHTADQAEAAQVLSNYLLQNKCSSETTLVAENSLNIPSANLKMHELPSLNLKSEIKEEPLLQILKLIPACVYAPLDVSKFNELLMFPYLPFNLQLARSFARLMSSVPGRGSDAWENIKEEWFAKQETKTEAAEQLEKIRFYLEEPLLEDTGPENGKIVPRIISILEKIAANSAQRASLLKEKDPEQSESFFRLNKACKDLENSFVNLPNGMVLNRLTYNQLVREVISSAEHNINKAEVYSCDVAYNGTCLLSPAKSVIAWNCIKTEKAGRINWLPAEIDWFTKNNVAYNNPEELYQQGYYNDYQLVKKTNRKLILMIPDMILGESTEKGGLYSRIRAASDNMQMVEYRFPEQQEKMKNKLGISMVPRKRILLPSGAPAYWRLKDTSLIEPRDYESYSSLKDLLHYPYAWFLNYQAKIRTSAMLSLSANEAALQGTLAHRIMEKVIQTANQPFSIPVNELKNRIDKYYDDILEKEGALLLLPEMQKKNSYFRFILHRSIPRFLQECRLSGWKKIAMEQPLEKQIGSIKVNSRLDALLEKDNAKAVVDIKYFKSNARQNEMAADNDIQLILYAGLAEENNNFPMSAYYFVKDMQFLAKHKLGFINADTVGKTGEIAEILHRQLLEKIIRTAEYRWTEIKKEGKIEVGEEVSFSQLDIFNEKGDELMPLPGLKARKPEESKKSPRNYNDYENLIRIN